MSAVLTEFTTREMIEYRKPVLTRVDVSWENAGGTWQTGTARMEDRSVGGVSIRAKLPIPFGSKVRIQSRHEDFAGEARHCRADGNEFLIGIQRAVADRANASPSLSAPVAPPHATGSGRPITSTVVAPTPKIPTLPKRQENRPSDAPRVEQKLERPPVNGIALATPMPARENDHEINNRNIPLSRPRDLDPLFLLELEAELRAEMRAELRAEVRAVVQAELRTESQTEQPPKLAGKEEKHMRSKWLELPWRKKPDDLSSSGTDAGEASSEGESSNSPSYNEKENFMSDLTQPTPKVPVRSAREVPGFQVDLSSMEDIYRAVGIAEPPRGYSINKVVEMLNSEHIRDLSKELKRAAVLMALDAAGTSIEQLQKDAKARQDALDSHEAQQRKQVEAEWARKAEEIVQIQAEMESIKAHYTARISRNMDGVSRQKATFADWVKSKQQECQGMAEAVELCSKSHVSAPPANPPSEVSLVKVSAKTV
ncbi:MAG: hypothetical protein WBX02_20700 [Terriglobales bacterium]